MASAGGVTTAKVLLIGAGGLGCGAAFGLAAAEVGCIDVIDDDAVDETNLHRQILHGASDIGARKVVSLAHALGRRFPGVNVAIHDTRFQAANAATLIAACDVVIDGSDNFATKFLANDAAVLAGKPLIHGAAVGVGGQILTVPARPGHRSVASRVSPPTAPCYRCLFEEPPAPGVASCAEARVLGPVPGVIGALQAAEAVRLLTGRAPAFVGRLVQYDSLRMIFRAVTFRANPSCAVCGTAAPITALDPSRYITPECAAP